MSLSGLFLCLIIAVLVLKPEQWGFIAKRSGALWAQIQQLLASIKLNLHEQNLQEQFKNNTERALRAEQQDNNKQ